MGLSNTILHRHCWLRWLSAVIAIWFWPVLAVCDFGVINTVASGVSYPEGMAVDNNGNLYIAASAGHRVLKLDSSTGNISTVAGNGYAGYTGDGNTATQARLYYPNDVAIDTSGNLYIADSYNQCIRKVNAGTGVISTVAGDGTQQQGDSGDGGPASNAKLRYPYSVTLDNSNNLYIADGGNHRIRKVNAATGIISTVVGTGAAGYSGDGGLATNAKLSEPHGIVFDSGGNLYIADTNNIRIRRVDANTSNITTVAGNGEGGYRGDGIAATATSLDQPKDVALDGGNNLYIVTASDHRIRKVDAASGEISTIAGSGRSGYSGDGGVATNAQLSSPDGIALDQSRHNLYIADTANARIRRVALAQGASHPNLTILPMLMPLDKGTAQTLTFTVNNLPNAASAATLGVPTLSGYYTEQFTLNTAASNDCANITLNAGASCTVSVSYTPDPTQSLPNTMTVLNVPDSRGIIHAQALISNNESDSGQAARRLPDVLTSINVPSLTVGNPATITWTMTGYQTDAHSQIALFECTTDGAGNAVSTCGDTYASRTAASDVLSPTTTADGDWTYLGVRAKNRTYSYTYTPTKAGPVVLRFYQKSGIDKAADNTGTSLLIPGGLNGSGSSFNYFDAEGRRIKATVQ